MGGGSPGAYLDTGRCLSVMSRGAGRADLGSDPSQFGSQRGFFFPFFFLKRKRLDGCNLGRAGNLRAWDLVLTPVQRPD